VSLAEKSPQKHVMLRDVSSKVWIINQYALPKGEAGITRHGDFASVLTKHGFEVTVFASGFDYLTRQKDRSGEDHAKTESYEGVKFVWLKTPAYSGNDSKRVKNMVSFFGMMLREASFGKYGKPDIILGSSPHLLSALAGHLLAVRYQVPFVFEVRDVWPEVLIDLDALKTGSSTQRILSFIAKHLYKRAARVLTVPPKAHTYIARLGINPEKLISLPNGVFLEPSTNAAQLPESLEHLFTLEQDRFKVVYMGAHGVANDLSNVLTTATFLRRYHPSDYDKLAFFFVGGGQQQAELIEQAKALGLEHTHFHPPVPKAAVPLVTAKADALLVHLSPAEFFSTYGLSPNKLYDYLAAAKPILFSTLDTETVLQKHKAGLTFAPGNPEAFAQTLLHLMAMAPEEREAMGKCGRKAVETEYDLERLGETLATLLSTVLREKKR
jgi:glycosyltransferase involved in cell wall biosynthesis